MKIYFTKRAENNYRLIKSYISKEWGERVAEVFEQKTNDFLDLLENFSEIAVVEVIEKQIRGFRLTKQITVFYRIKANRILILTCFDTRHNPKKK
jgi:plasmid stabilization system protein ParE